MSEPNVKLSSTVFKALRTLETVAELGGDVSLNDVAEAVELDRSTAYRLLTTLVSAGYLLRSADSKKYRLSFKLLSVGRSLLSNMESDSVIRDALEGITKQTQETVNFSVLDHFQTVIRIQSTGSQLLAVNFKVGDRASLHCTSIGKLILAYQDSAFVERVIARGLPKAASNTITDPEVLRGELAVIRQQGYASDVHEYSDDLCCVAAPIFGPNGRLIGGINFSGPDTRFSGVGMDRLRDLLVNASREVSFALGATPA